MGIFKYLKGYHIKERAVLFRVVPEEKIRNIGLNYKESNLEWTSEKQTNKQKQMLDPFNKRTDCLKRWWILQMAIY